MLFAGRGRIKSQKMFCHSRDSPENGNDIAVFRKPRGYPVITEATAGSGIKILSRVSNNIGEGYTLNDIILRASYLFE